jgi:hypothetical protein
MVIRNAGGRANASAVNDILVLDGLMGITDIVVVHHTGLSSPLGVLLGIPGPELLTGRSSAIDCGQTLSKDAKIRATLKERLPSNQEIDSMKFGEITELGNPSSASTPRPCRVLIWLTQFLVASSKQLRMI